MAEQKPPDGGEPSLEDVADAHLRSIGEALSRRGRVSLRRSVLVNGVRVGLTAGPDRRAPRDDFGPMPDAVRALPRADQRVYAHIRDARAGPGGPGRVLGSGEIERGIRAAAPNDDLDISTVRHALKRLRDAGAVWSHPARGYLLGPEQPALPFDARQPNDLPGAEPVE
ncbi:MAG TPA: hypothetical protein VGE74_10035 [Gemmata sp.]